MAHLHEYRFETRRALAEYDGSNSLQRKFAYGNTIDEVLFMIDSDSTEYYYAHDDLHGPALRPISASSAPWKRGVHQIFHDRAGDLKFATGSA